MKGETNRDSCSFVQGTPESLRKSELPAMKSLPNELNSDSDTFAQATIMMVDDESTTMEVMQAFLEDAGYQRFVLIEDSPRAMAKIEEFPPDILYGGYLHELPAILPVDGQGDDLGIQAQKAHDELEAHRMHSLGTQLDQLLRW